MRNSQEVETPTDIVSVLDQDHAALRHLAGAVVDGPEDGGAAFVRWSDLMIRHEVAEELVVYPVLLSYQGGAAVVDSRLEDQSRVERLLISVERQVPGTPGFEEGASRLVLDHLAHMGMEDSQVIPILSSRLRRRRKAELGKRFRQVSRVAPMHHAPSAGGRRPIGDRAADLTARMRHAG